MWAAPPRRRGRAALVACAAGMALAAACALLVLSRPAARASRGPRAPGRSNAPSGATLRAELSGWLEGTAEPWIEALFPRSKDDQLRLAAPASEYPSSVYEPPPSEAPPCPPGKLTDAYHLNAEQETCQQVCIGSGLRGAFISHGGVLGDTCVNLGYTRFLAEGRRAGVRYYIFTRTADSLLAVLRAAAAHAQAAEGAEAGAGEGEGGGGAGEEVGAPSAAAPDALGAGGPQPLSQPQPLPPPELEPPAAAADQADGPSRGKRHDAAARGEAFEWRLMKP